MVSGSQAPGQRAAVTAILAASTLAAAPTASADIIRFSFTEPESTETLEPCGAVISYTAERSIVIRTDDDGQYVRVVQLDVYTGTITYAGETYRANDRQVHLRYFDRDGVPVGVLNGQGLFTHLPRTGVAFFDVGHLVFNDDTGATLFDSDKVVGLGEPFDYAGAICAALLDR